MTHQARTIQHPGGWHNYRGSFFGRLYEAWLILRGTYSLHRAWQSGYDQHIRDESLRRRGKEMIGLAIGGRPVVDNPDAPAALRLQQGLTTPNTNKHSQNNGAANVRDVGNVAKSEERPASAPPVSPPIAKPICRSLPVPSHNQPTEAS